MLGIAIDENTAIVVEGDEFEVIGTSYVIIHDNVSNGFHFHAGAVQELRSR